MPPYAGSSRAPRHHLSRRTSGRHRQRHQHPHRTAGPCREAAAIDHRNRPADQDCRNRRSDYPSPEAPAATAHRSTSPIPSPTSWPLSPPPTWDRSTDCSAAGRPCGTPDLIHQLITGAAAEEDFSARRTEPVPGGGPAEPLSLPLPPTGRKKIGPRQSGNGEYVP